MRATVVWKSWACVALLGAAGLAGASAAPVRLAPDVAWDGIKGRSSVRSVKGQPVVVVFGKSARDGAFRKQVKRLKGVYDEFAARGTIFVAALAAPDLGVIPSNIPFVIARDGGGAAAAYGVERGFGVAVIGTDGNLDYVTAKVQPASRIKDVIQNSYAVQAAARRAAQ
jgi:hypothetical protein